MAACLEHGWPATPKDRTAGQPRPGTAGRLCAALGPFEDRARLCDGGDFGNYAQARADRISRLEELRRRDE